METREKKSHSEVKYKPSNVPFDKRKRKRTALLHLRSKFLCRLLKSCKHFRLIMSSVKRYRTGFSSVKHLITKTIYIKDFALSCLVTCMTSCFLDSLCVFRWSYHVWRGRFSIKTHLLYSKKRTQRRIMTKFVFKMFITINKSASLSYSLQVRVYKIWLHGFIF